MVNGRKEAEREGGERKKEGRERERLRVNGRTGVELKKGGRKS